MAEQATTQPTSVVIVNAEPRVRVYIKEVATTVQGHTSYTHETVTLRPGANRLPLAMLSDAKIKEQMRDDIESARVYPMDKPLAKMSPVDALKIVDLTGDVEMLNEWLTVETREPVKQAIRTQLTGITGLAS